MRARLAFEKVGADKEKVRQTIDDVQDVLRAPKRHIADTFANPYAGLPELTNASGERCFGSCPTQAWSSATLIELIFDIVQFSKSIIL